MRRDRLTPREKNYLRAMASLSAEEHRSADIAMALVSSLGAVRAKLIKYGILIQMAIQ
jgi:hypothetical protein